MMKYLVLIMITTIHQVAWAQAPQVKTPIQNPPEQKSTAPAVPPAPTKQSVPAAAAQQAIVPAPVPQAAQEQNTAAVNNDKAADPLAGIIEDYTYSPAGKRDPFLPMESGSSDMSLGPIFELQKFDLDQLLVSGIIWNVKSPKAMILDPAGKSHVIGMNDRIGRNNGYVARIREGEVVVIESFRSQTGKVSYQTRMLRISKD